MSDEREDAPNRSGPGKAGAWKDFVSSALLIAAVGGILIAGFVLKADRAADSATLRGAAGETPPTEIILGSTITPESAPPATSVPEPAPPAIEPRVTPPAAPQIAPTDPTFERLAKRAAADVDRLGAAKGPWTAQLLVACRLETVDRVIAASRGAAKLYVLPTEMHGDACFRICWGSYRSAKEAVAAADLPKALRGKDKIAAAEIASVLR